MRKYFILLIYILTNIETSSAIELPNKYINRNEAIAAECQFASIMGPSADACFQTSFHENQMDLAIYKLSNNGSYLKIDTMPITSWYWGAKISLVDVMHNGTSWMLIQTEGMRGTGVSQKILLILAWDGNKFKTVASESLGYRCAIPPNSAYFFDVQYKFITDNNKPNIHLDYILTENDNVIGQWSDSLLWDDSRFTFIPEKVVIKKANSMTKKIINEIAKVRKYSMRNPLDPHKDSLQWITKSGLIEILLPACDP